MIIRDAASFVQQSLTITVGMGQSQKMYNPSVFGGQIYPQW